MANEVCFLVTILRPVLYSTICKLKNLNFVYYDSEAEFNYTLARARQYFAQDAYEDLRRKYKSAHRFKKDCNLKSPVLQKNVLRSCMPCSEFKAHSAVSQHRFNEAY